MSHLLVVEATGDENEPFDRWIEHLEDCPTEIIYYNPINDNHRHEYICGIGYWESYYGLIDLADDPRFSIPGKYKVGFYHYWSGSLYDEEEAYLYYEQLNKNDN